MTIEDVILIIGFIVFVLFITWYCLVKHTLNKVNGMPKYKDLPKPFKDRSDYKPPPPRFPKSK